MKIYGLGAHRFLTFQVQPTAAPSDIVFDPHITHITAASGRASFENKLAQKGSKVGRRQRSEGLTGFGTGPPQRNSGGLESLNAPKLYPGGPSVAPSGPEVDIRIGERGFRPFLLLRLRGVEL